MNWSEKEIDDWISLDDRILEAKIETPFLTPMNPLEIRAKYLQDVLDDVLCERPSLTYSEAILFLEKEFEKETVEYGIENRKIPSSVEEFEEYKMELHSLEYDC